MAKGLMSAALLASCLGAGSLAVAQPLPGPAGLPSPAPIQYPPAIAPCEAPPPAPALRGDLVDERTCFGTDVYIGFDYLYWYTERQKAPPLVSTGAITDPLPGALGQPNSQVVPVTTTPGHNGGRLTLGYGVNQSTEWSVEGNFFILEQASGGRTLSSSGAPGSNVLSRPFFNVNAGLEDADPIAFPTVSSGTIVVGMPSRLYGGDANLRYLAQSSSTGEYRIVYLVGFRFLRLDEKLLIDESVQDLPGLGVPGNSTQMNENFTTHNTFYGGQVGFEYDQTILGPLMLGIAGKLAVGSTLQSETVSGRTSITQPDGTVTTTNNLALLVQPSNAGQRSRSVISVAPEATIRLAWAFNDNFRVGAGYQFLYWSGVARPGDQVDRNISIQALNGPAQIGPALPAAMLSSSTFWAMGLTLNFELSF